MTWKHACFGALVLAATSAAHADPLNSAALPENTTWVMHLDVDRARLAGPLWNLARAHVFEPRRAEWLPRVTVLERVTGMQLPRDLHDVTLYGAAYGPASVCIRIHGAMDRNTITAFLRGDPEYREADYNGHTILSWRDKANDRVLSATFVREDLALLAPDAAVIQRALDTIDGKAAGLKADSPLSPAPAAGEGAARENDVPLFWLAGRDLAELPRAQRTESPLLLHMEAASLAIKWNGKSVVSEALVTAKDPDAARQMLSVVQGVKAFVALSAGDPNAAPRMKEAAAAMQNLTCEAAGKVLKGQWTVDAEKIEAALSLVQQEQSPRTRP